MTGSRVEVILGSKTDDDELFAKSKLTDILTELGIAWNLSYCSAHRNAYDLSDYVIRSYRDGARVFIGCASMAAHLPGAIIGACIDGNIFPLVIGVALESEQPFQGGLDAMMAVNRMPPGVPIAAAGVGLAGLRNAALIAGQAMAIGNRDVARNLAAYMKANTKKAQFGVRKHVPPSSNPAERSE